MAIIRSNSSLFLEMREDFYVFGREWMLFDKKMFLSGLNKVTYL